MTAPARASVPRPALALLLAAPALLFFAPLVALNRGAYLRDTALYFYPHKAMAAAALRAGRLPQWNPREFGGLPFLADPNFNVFHPLSFLTDLLPLPLGFTLLLLACALLGAFGTFALARRLEVSEGGALIAALAFAWAGPFLSVLEGGQVVAAAFLPWVCAAALSPSLPAVAIACALLFVSGTPEIGASALLFGLLLSRQRARFLLGVLLGAGLAAVQIVPTAAFLRESSRAGGFALAEAATLALSWRRLPELLSPLLRREAAAPLAYLEAIHLGVVALALAAVGARRRPVLWAAAFALLVLALGTSSPLYAMAWKALPLLRWIRYPEKFLVPVSLVVAVHAGAGADALDRVLSFARPRLRTGLLVALLAAELAVPAASLDLSVPERELAARPETLSAIARDSGAPPWAWRVDVQQLGLTASDVAAVGEPGWPQRRRVLAVRQAALYGSAAAALGVHLGRGYSGFTSGETRSFFGTGPRSLDRLAVRYAIDFGTRGKPSPYAALGYQPIGTEAGGLVRLWRNPRARPRLWLSSRVLRGRPGDAPPACDAVWLPEGDLAAAHGLLAEGCRDVAPARGEAAIDRFEDERIEAHADLPAPALAVLADTMARGWSATVDGRPAPLVHADGALRAVPLSPGQHRIVFSYRAPGLLAGAALSLLSLLVLAAALARRRPALSPARVP